MTGVNLFPTDLPSNLIAVFVHHLLGENELQSQTLDHCCAFLRGGSAQLSVLAVVVKDHIFESLDANAESQVGFQDRSRFATSHTAV